MSRCSARYADGTVQLSFQDLVAPGFGDTWGLTTGRSLRFGDATDGVPWGRLLSWSDAAGNITAFTSRTEAGDPTEVQRSVTTGGVTTTDSLVYAYVTEGSNPATVGASERGTHVMHQPKVEVLSLRGKADALDTPGVLQTHAGTNEIDVAIGPGPPWDPVLPRFSPIRKSDKPKNPGSAVARAFSDTQHRFRKLGPWWAADWPAAPQDEQRDGR